TALFALGACGKDATPQNETPATQADAAAENQAPENETSSEAAASGQSAIAEAAESYEELRRDKFSYANFNQVRVSDLALDVAVDFDTRTLEGSAVLSLVRLDPAATTLALDTSDLDIRSVEAGVSGANGEDYAPTPFTLGQADPVMGAELAITLPDGADRVRVTYKTSPHAEGLQWLDAAQTAGKTHPFVYSQNQTIYARTMAPLQDTPAVRMTYSATVRTPGDLLAVMSAEQDAGPRDGDYHFEMPQPVPPYLLAISVGDIAFRPISDTIGVYAEPSVVDAAAAEFSDTPQMEIANSALYGPYRWGRYDMLVLPPSYPFGGMENPRLTFLTPTLIAGDKSLTNTVAHELAHSWSGNLVTNATWRDAWLNEGVTSYVENRVMEEIYGRDRAVMEQSLAMADLKEEIAELAPERTRLHLPATLNHPDDAFTGVAYSKGQFFLQFLEERYGRDIFDAFLSEYFDHFAFKTVITADFEAYLREHLTADHPDAVSEVELTEWLYGEGLPASAPKPASDAFEKISTQIDNWLASGAAINTGGWTAHEWIYFVNTLPDDLDTDRMAQLDAAYGLTDSTNAEVAFAWYMKAVKTGYEPAMPALSAFLHQVGRGKFLYPLYKALAENGRRAFAEEIFETARPGYHPIAQRRVEETLQAAN
ncbi:MAG: M1 family metallopeptidase, partial [Parvularculaceae bacterium]